MSRTKKINSALISVFYKDNLDPIIKKLHDLGVILYSTGGTQAFIENLGIPVKSVEGLTSFPEILGGRVKTLHPKIFGGILGRRELDSDIAQMQQHEIPEIDLVIVDLYPFEETLASGANEEDIIEKIDIGGISLIRAAAKNYNDVVIVASRNDYPSLLNLLNEQKGSSELSERKTFAAKAFAMSSHYDAAIFNYFNQTEQLPILKQSINNGATLRYGENPHQKGVFYGDMQAMFEKLNGKELSYNNLLDVDAAVNLMADFTAEPTFAILKHNNACGVASRPKIVDAYLDALAGDPVPQPRISDAPQRRGPGARAAPLLRRVWRARTRLSSGQERGARCRRARPAGPARHDAARSRDRLAYAPPACAAHHHLHAGWKAPYPGRNRA
jgi:phosphoribosylaminoimidazolecarboxamide formyltransferase/IMP cyclohydrolase